MFMVSNDFLFPWSKSCLIYFINAHFWAKMTCKQKVCILYWNESDQNHNLNKQIDLSLSFDEY